MKRINKYISLLLATALLASCDKFDEINTDPEDIILVIFHTFTPCHLLGKQFVVYKGFTSTGRGNVQQ